MNLDERSKELVAFGSAIGSNCIPCLEWHLKKCIEIGLTKYEMQEAFDMAIKVKNVPINKINGTYKNLINEM